MILLESRSQSLRDVTRKVHRQGCSIRRAWPRVIGLEDRERGHELKNAGGL